VIDRDVLHKQRLAVRTRDEPGGAEAPAPAREAPAVAAVVHLLSLEQALLRFGRSACNRAMRCGPRGTTHRELVTCPECLAAVVAR
jgi:hypothetical protein